MNNIRQHYSEKYLKGKGGEFGALHNPLCVSKQSKVLYVDRFAKEELLERFPELKEHAESIVSTDIILDLDNSEFETLKKQKLDFFIANHVIEHLVNPVRFLKQIHDVMTPGSILYLSVPDKNYTFDKNRELTSQEHLWNDYKEDTRILSIEHLNDFLLKITKDHIEPRRKARIYFKNDKLPLNWFKKRKIYNLHRKRSIHVHVWDQKTFDQFLDFSMKNLNLKLKIIDSSCSKDNENNEMIYLLEKQ